MKKLRAGALVLIFLAGCVISPRRTSVSNGGGGNGTPTGKLYVTNDAANSIVRFDNAFTATGNVTPAVTISGAATQLNNPQYIFLDATSNRLFVANTNSSSILVFDNMSTLNGNVSPTRVITSASLATPTDVALDKGRDLLYVADTNSVLVFAGASTANGTTVPVRTLQPGFTPGALLIDAANDRLFAADPVTNSINVFEGASTLSGLVLVTRRLVGSSTQLAQPFGLQIDSAGRLVVANFAPPSITIYANAAAATTTGNIAPVTMISGSNTTLAGPTQLTINTVAAGGELFVADPFGGDVSVFGSIGTLTGNQNIAPTRSITGPNTTLTGSSSATARGVAFDTTR